MRRTATICAGLLVLGALAAGCGGGSTTTTATTTGAVTTTAATGPKALTKAQYTSQLAAIGLGIYSSLSTISSVKTKAQAVTTLTRVREDMTTAVAALDAITPPANVRTQHAAFEHAVRDFAAELGPLIAKVRSTGLAAIEKAPAPKGITEIQTAAAAFASAGYSING